MARRSILQAEGPDKQRKAAEARDRKPWEQAYATARPSVSRERAIKNQSTSPINMFYREIKYAPGVQTR